MCTTNVFWQSGSARTLQYCILSNLNPHGVAQIDKQMCTTIRVILKSLFRHLPKDLITDSSLRIPAHASQVAHGCRVGCVNSVNNVNNTEMLPNASKYFKNLHNSLQIKSNPPTYSQIFPSVPKICKMFRNVPRRFVSVEPVVPASSRGSPASSRESAWSHNK